jgi:hypothetical protein
MTATEAVAPEAATTNVCVAVHVRPLVENEAMEGCQEVLYTTPGEPQVRPALPCRSPGLSWRLFLTVQTERRENEGGLVHVVTIMYCFANAGVDANQSQFHI